MDFLLSAAGIWLMAMIILSIIEALVPGLVSIWFAFGALIAMIAAALNAPVWLQIALFIVASVASLILTRPLVKKYVNGRAQPTNADMIIGKECIVKEEINNILGTGAVVAGGKTWTAVSYNDDVIISVGTRATVEEIRGVKTVVKPLEIKEDK